MTQRLYNRTAAGSLLLLLLMGCRPAPTAIAEPAPLQDVGTNAAADPLSIAASQSQVKRCPLAVLVVDPGRGAEDRAAVRAFQSVGSTDAVLVVLDLDVSRNRAAAAPLHALESPTLLCLSPRGVILSRDLGGIDVTLARKRISAAQQRWRDVDEQLLQLQADAASPGSVDAKMSLADFWLDHGNDREAIAPLEAVAHDPQAAVDVRVGAWVKSGRAHLWIGEPEKARHVAQALIDTLGPQSRLATAGGELVRGLQDSKAKRYDRARSEFSTAVAAAADSPYGREAAEALAKLP